MPRSAGADVTETRRAILDVAIDDASLIGFEGITIGRLAAEMNMSKSGLIGHFGSKEALQLAVLQSGFAIFLREVWKPVMREAPGRDRLLALSYRWITYIESRVFPGGCLMTTASVEFDHRRGRVRENVESSMRQWLQMLEREAATARDAGELPPETDPADVAFELNAIATGANITYQLHNDPATLARARRAMERVLTP